MYLTNQKLTLSYFTKKHLLDYEKQDQKDENARVECERLLIEAQGYIWQVLQKLSVVKPTGYVFEFESYAALVAALLEQRPEDDLGDLSQLSNTQVPLALDKCMVQYEYVIERIQLIYKQQQNLGNPYVENFGHIIAMEQKLLKLLAKIQDQSVLNNFLQCVQSMRTMIGIKSVSPQSAKETLTRAKKKIMKESA